jgi:hypothetical protein
VRKRLGGPKRMPLRGQTGFTLILLLKLFSTLKRGNTQLLLLPTQYSLLCGG